MVGLNAARILIVDDVESEVLDLVRVLWKIGVAPLYIDPTTLETSGPQEPLSGIRLAFLDMDIVGGGVDAKSKVAALANCVMKLIHKNNGPYIAVAWTNHPELVDELDNYIFSIAAFQRPAVFVTITKLECMDIATLGARINQELKNRGPVRMLQAWEMASVQAAGEVTSELSSIASGSETTPKPWRDGWNTAMLRVMHTCGREFVGEGGMLDGSSAYKAFCHSMIPLLGDRLERGVSSIAPDLQDSAQDLLAAPAKLDCGLEAKARINTMLHCSYDNLGTPSAGSVYPATSGAFSSILPDVTKTIEPLIDKAGKTPEAFQEFLREVATKVIPVAVEASPSCDHVQGKLIVPRLIAGIIVSAEVAVAFKKGKSRPDSFWELGPLWIPADTGTSGIRFLILNCLVVASGNFDLLRSANALFRLRGQAFSMLQVCFASHAVRPGMLLLR